MLESAGCRLDPDMEADFVLMQAYPVNAEALGRTFDDDDQPLPKFSTDMANVSLRRPYHPSAHRH